MVVVVSVTGGPGVHADLRTDPAVHQYVGSGITITEGAIATVLQFSPGEMMKVHQARSAAKSKVGALGGFAAAL